MFLRKMHFLRPRSEEISKIRNRHSLFCADDQDEDPLALSEPINSDCDNDKSVLIVVVRLLVKGRSSHADR